jgi:transcriptional regulator with PAS, ATPase and Fis domain
MVALRDEIAKIAPTRLTVMIRGERGTGKELVAQEIHLRSDRASGPFISVNCAGLQDSLIESELFGCEKGAFTGAVFRKGKFELAHGGTLFLDEVAELSMIAQPKLLRVLSTREVDRVGGRQPIPSDFRLVVATNQNLEEMADHGKFRQDLYDRLNMDCIRVPPLRERPEDISTLADYFIGHYISQARRPVSGVSEQVLDMFRTYWWPGNVRELESIIHRAVFVGRTELIRAEDLSNDFVEKRAAGPVKVGNYHELMQKHSRQLVINALAQCGDSRLKAAALLGLSRSNFYSLLEQHGLNGKKNGKNEKF